MSGEGRRRRPSTVPKHSARSVWLQPDVRIVSKYPAVEIHAVDPELALAIVDDYSPAAVEEHEDGIRVFFARAEDRDHAATAVLGAYPAAQVVALEVDDEDWARRSQADLKPVTVGRITVYPHPAPGTQQHPAPSARHPTPAIALVIQPSMGFGTGHHATTRLCLAALQAIDVGGKSVLDVGTGSGILAIASERLGAASVLGIDHDASALASAGENLSRNPEVHHVRFEEADLREASLPPADIVCANLTGALLVSAAPLLKRAIKTGGVLIVSGLMAGEEQGVRDALAPGTVSWRGAEQEWVALLVRF